MTASLFEVAILLAALVIAAPVARLLGIGTVLGYLLVGVLIGPQVLGFVYDRDEASEILHFAEFGVVLLLFLIGLELRPKRLMSMRGAIFGLGGAQMGLTALVLAAGGIALGLGWKAALFAGLALALSSTAFALQVMEESGDLQARHGRLGFAVLLFQDLAAIPLIALAPLFAASGAKSAMDWTSAAGALATIVAVVVVGHFVLDRFMRLVAMTKVKEAMTAAALLTVVTVTLVMQWAGLSASLGAFIAGALLAESSYRHSLEADLQPFEGLLLGLFFTAIGMSLNLKLVTAAPVAVLGLTVGLVVVKALVLIALGSRAQGLAPAGARRLGLALSQGGEFGFVLLAAAVTAGTITRAQNDLLAVVITLSMALTPLLLALERMVSARHGAALPLYDALPDREAHVVIAGFGRFGQIVARVLRAKSISFTALDISAEQVELVRSFGSKAFFGDASRPDILDAAQTAKARAFVLAIDDVEASMRTAELVKSRYPDVPIYARARNRNHAHRLLELGVTIVQRETFLSSLDITRQLLRGLGLPADEVERTIKTFRTHDEKRLIDDYKHYSDMERLRARARSDAETLTKLFEEDKADLAKLAEPAEARKDAKKDRIR